MHSRAPCEKPAGRSASPRTDAHSHILIHILWTASGPAFPSYSGKCKLSPVNRSSPTRDTRFSRRRRLVNCSTQSGTRPERDVVMSSAHCCCIRNQNVVYQYTSWTLNAEIYSCRSLTWSWTCQFAPWRKMREYHISSLSVSVVCEVPDPEMGKEFVLVLTGPRKLSHGREKWKNFPGLAFQVVIFLILKQRDYYRVTQKRLRVDLITDRVRARVVEAWR